MQLTAPGWEKVLGEALRRAPADEAARLAWPLVCGGKVAQRTRPLAFAGGVLRVGVPDQTWRAQLAELEHRYLNEFARVLGNETVEQIEFVVAVREQR